MSTWIHSDLDGHGNDNEFIVEFFILGFHMGSRKDKSVEEIYKKMTQLEHVIARPDTYVGSVQFQSEKMWVWSEEQEMMVNKQINFVPGLYKIFDEILVNAADNKQRDPRGMSLH